MYLIIIPEGDNTLSSQSSIEMVCKILAGVNTTKTKEHIVFQRRRKRRGGRGGGGGSCLSNDQKFQSHYFITSKFVEGVVCQVNKAVFQPSKNK